ncbi:hypothetical protein Vafri_11229 [Volvox africanus]|nr:hypothetical protein Vafri_11229 [Volvox africanus]
MSFTIMKASLAPAALVSTVLAIFLLSIEACARRQLRSGSGEQIANGTLLSLTTSFPDGRDSDEFYLRQDDGQMYRLSFCSGAVSAADLTPNVRFAITYSSIQDGVMHSCQKPRQLDGEPPATSRAGRRSLFGNQITTPIRPTFLIYIVTMCGYDKPAAATTEILKDVFYNDSRIRTLAGYYNTCSYGKVNLEPSRVVILENLTIPCTGELKDLPFTFPSGNQFDTRGCGVDNMVKWHYYLDSIASEQHVVPTDFNHKVLLLPEGFTATKPNCNSFMGSASAGPWMRNVSGINSYGTGLIWWSEEMISDLEGMFHEVGHNLGMAHANIPGGCDDSDQCDHTCPMGAPGNQGIRCLNAPHLWQLGWGQPFRQLTDTNLPIGTKKVLTIPPQLTTSKSFVMVDLNTMPGSMKLYVAVRINTQPYDLPYTAELNGNAFLTVHSSNGTKAQQYSRTVLLADIQIGDTYVDRISGLVVSYRKRDDTNGGVVATFCRQAAATEEICGDGLDDDCDGLADAIDPDCNIYNPPRRLQPPAKSHPPSQSTPPPPKPPPRNSSQPRPPSSSPRIQTVVRRPPPSPRN